MKQFFLINIVLLCSILNTQLYSQDNNCKVLTAEISGSYSGKCKNGLAHGKGIARGKDWFEGKFKSGLPNGHGKYVWANGNYYIGYFKNGLKSGNGKLFFKVNGKDSVLNGIWKADSLYKVNLPPKYSIIRSVNLTRYSIQRVSDGNKVMFSFLRNGGTNNSISNLQLSSNYGNQTKIGSNHGFENVKFPFTCKVSFTTPTQFKASSFEVIFEIEISEPGDWIISINN